MIQRRTIKWAMPTNTQLESGIGNRESNRRVGIADKDHD
ncbi:hypothetical protein LYNGBM3L_05270 [Moorena producens 3L]|uniref:Uncharacterized protein n=1 Tax=Moorena producens 3L TaxID=489825 RepID=F4XRV0_9CYAN|nr:hypothetical protein LYNGBM3L_05270 [Moorena producens 3L]